MNESYASFANGSSQASAQAVPAPPLTSELNRLEFLSAELECKVNALEERLNKVLPISAPGTGEKVIAHDSYGIPFPDYVSDSNDRINRQITRLENLINDIAI